MRKSNRIYVAGHRGLAGSAITSALENRGYQHIITRTHEELDLTDLAQTRKFFQRERPEYVFLAAAKVGGILSNSNYPVDFLRENLLIQTNVFHESWQAGVKKLLFLGSSCIYPKMAQQPISEDALMTGKLEPTNDAYAIAKIAGIQACKAYRKQYNSNFISIMPTNLYGPNDNFHPEHSHVIPGLIHRFHEAKLNALPKLDLWGSGTSRREFLHCLDLAEACLFLMEKYNSHEIINVGWGKDCLIKELAEKIANIVDYTGKINWDTSHPDGTPRKILNTTKIKELGWKPRISLSDGLEETYKWYLKNIK